MARQTQTLKLGYIVDGEITSQVTEERRMLTIDSQLRGLFEVLGNGVLDGWTVGRSSSGSFAVGVTAGKGVISLVVVENEDSTTITTLFPSSVNYVYANRLPTSYWDRSVAFSVTVSEMEDTEAILLATVTTSSSGITSIDNGVRRSIGLVASIEDVVRAHRHVGGTDNPDPIDLKTQVTGVLSQENLPDLDASKVKYGKLPKSVVPKIDHSTGLSNSGELTHPQLDSFAQGLSAFGRTVMGETALVNLLQLVLALKHQWPEVDEYLVNHLAFIPGISPDSLVDFANTTAEVDTRPSSEGGQHKIYGTTGPGMRVFTKTWNSPAEFEGAEKDGVAADGDVLRLDAEDASVVLEDFATLGNWETKIEDLSSGTSTIELDSTNKVSGAYSAKVGVGTDDVSNMAFTMRKVFASQDWSEYDGVVFYLNTQDVEHGDLFFYFNDATAGVQNSYTLVLGRNEPTINRETLANGWREIYVDLSAYQRSAVNMIGFFMSTQHGWDATRPFELNVDKVTLFAGSRFVSGGGARLTYGNGFPQDFWRARWDAVVPAGTSLSVRARVSNSLSDFDDGSPTPAVWSATSATSGFELPTAGGSLYAYCQLEAIMTASANRKSSPVLMRLYLDRRASADDSSFAYEEQDQWESGKRFNVDTESSPGSIRIASMSDIDNVFYGSGGLAVQADASLADVFAGSGASLPPSTPQAIAGAASGFGQLSAVRRGEDDTLWVADTENDRIVQVDKSGGVVFGLWGSNLSQPFDGYGTEESGPGSNKDFLSPPASPTTNVPVALYALFNPSTRVLSVVFSADLETVEDDAATTFRADKLVLKVGAKRVYFGSGTGFSLFGIVPSKYAGWAMSANKFVGQFTFRSHVLQATLSQADSVALTSAVSMLVPSVAASGTDEQALVEADGATLSFVTPNVDIGSESSDDNGIRIRVNGGTYSYHRTRTILLEQPAVSAGRNEVEATIVDGNDNPFGNSEASCALSFVLDPDGDHRSDPRISISSPRQGQSLASSPVEVEFESHNHPVLPVGSCVEYSVDGGAWQEHRTYDPVPLSGLSGGSHSVSMRLVDGDGDVVDSDWATATVSFNFGVSAAADVSLLVGAGAIRGVARTETTKTPEAVVAVHVANIHVVNMFCPVDLQVIPDETSEVNPSGDPTVLVAKLRSPSTTRCLASPPAARAATTDDAIFASNYLDGHSVVQYSMGGAVVFTNNAARFADTLANARTYLGSASKASPSDVVIADPIRMRAIVTRADLSTGEPKVIWEYSSDRLVSDFQLATDGTKEISVSDSSCDLPSVYVRAGESVVWTNDSSVPIRIYSGTTTPDVFAADPDLTLYGDEFASQELQPGEQYSVTFDDGGDFGWFAYPSIVTGTVGVSPAGVSQADEYLVVEKDPVPSVGSGRVSRVDSWGNIVWTFGEGVLYDPKDVRRLAGDSVIVST
jgi:hypothetical protein